MQEALQSNGQAKPRAAKAKKPRTTKAVSIHVPTIPVVINTSGIWPTEFNVLIKQKDVEEVTKGGIIVPIEKVEKDKYAEVEGMIIAVSPLAFCYERWPEGAKKPSEGDKVIIAKYSGVHVKGADGKEYLLTKDRDITALRY
jgi:co-chaperonin GroES (HSP10)